MVALSLVQSTNAALFTSQPLVAVVVGGTSNIGAHTVRTLAATHGKEGKGLRLYIIGRNTEAAEEIISHCQEVCPTGQFRFVQANDLALLKDVDIVCAKLIKSEEEETRTSGGIPKIDILIQTQAIFKPWDPRKDTSEGLDTFMSLLYYSRMRFTTQLLPLLLSSPLPAHVVSVYGPGRDANFIPSDLSLRSAENYTFNNSCSHVVYLKTFFMEHLATQHPGKLSLIHYFPGLILSPQFQDPEFPAWFRAVFKYGGPLIKLAPMALDAKECGARTLFNVSPRFPPLAVNGKPAAATSAGKIGVAESSDGVLGGGAYRVNYNNEKVATPKQYQKMREDGWLQKSVDHTLKAFKDIEEGRVFTE